MTASITHFVFVDFENVPTVDLALITRQPVRVTLMLGKNQKKLAVALVREIQRLGDRLQLIEVGASGHNALDLTLAHYLGRTAQQFPEGQYFIVSKDKDFDPLVAHLKADGIRTSRHDAFTSLPFLPQPKAVTPPKKAAAPKPVVPTKTVVPEDRMEKLIKRLKDNSAPRPKRKASLLARIGTDFGNKLDESGRNQKLEELVRRGVVIIEDKDKVRYL
ncbi:MAG: PIN domain-containing protein [Phycisphaerae bacterium]|jgi:hypothetical protein